MTRRPTALCPSRPVHPPTTPTRRSGESDPVAGSRTTDNAIVSGVRIIRIEQDVQRSALDLSATARVPIDPRRRLDRRQRRRRLNRRHGRRRCCRRRGYRCRCCVVVRAASDNQQRARYHKCPSNVTRPSTRATVRASSARHICWPTSPSEAGGDRHSGRRRSSRSAPDGFDDVEPHSGDGE